MSTHIQDALPVIRRNASTLPEGAQRQCRPRLHCGGEVLQRLLADPNVLVAIRKGMQAVKLCTNKILKFLTGGAG